jgi:FkbM family methyltransferase
VRRVPPRQKGLSAVVRVERLVAPPSGLMETRHVSGYKVWCDLSDSVQKSMFYRGTWEPTETALILEALPVGGCFLDVGANAGHYTLAAAGRVGPKGRVLAVEASSVNASRLVDTLTRNGLRERVAVHQVAVADVPGTMRLVDGPKGAVHGSRRLEAAAVSQDGELVDVTTLDALLTGGPKIDAVKIDVEGSDLRVLRGMKGILTTHRPALLIVEADPSQLVNFGDSVDDMCDFMGSLGYVGTNFLEREPWETPSLAFRPT